jgi:1A family penicillin-binding protein
VLIRFIRSYAPPLARLTRTYWRSVTLVIAAVFLIAVGTWTATCGFAGCPGAAELRAFLPSEGGLVLDRNGVEIGHLSPARRINVPLSQIPQAVQQAFIATEDRRFYRHGGVDFRGVLRATWRNITAGGIREGFSTITMQVARTAFIGNRFPGRSPRRKLLEIRLAGLLEKHLTKDQILEHYLNVIYLGNGLYGVEAASRDLFGKSVQSISLQQAAVLAAVTRSPTNYAPREFPDRARQRRNLVISLMRDQGFISRVNAERATAEPMRIATSRWRPTGVDEYGAIDAIRAVVDSIFPGTREGGGFVVHTTIDATAQAAADTAIEMQAAAIERESDRRDGVAMQGALVALDPQTGDIRALVGGRRAVRGGFNRALKARRQPGSAFKPFVYAAAIAVGFAPSAQVDDAPIEVAISGEVPWIPANYDDKYLGRTTLRRALMMSANGATVRVSRAVTEQQVIAAARRNGITSPLRPHPSLALGALEVTPLELITAYAPFANGGDRVVPRLVTRIETSGGAVLWSSEPERSPAMDSRDAWEMQSMLRGVVDFGTGRVIRNWGITGPIGGKTGTTNNGADVWFIGFTPSIVAGVWFGYDSPREIAYRAAGARFAAPAWAEFYRSGWSEPADAVWTPPEGMVAAEIDPETGELATNRCTHRQTEFFTPGTEPREYCQLHSGRDPAIAALQRAVGGLRNKLRRLFGF